jgi:KDO2-lipid IV(A) lauroyltransferase
MVIHSDPAEKEKSFRHLLSRPFFYRFGFSMGRLVPKYILYRIADILAIATYLSCDGPAKNVRNNLLRAFPQAADREVSRLARKIFCNFARYLVDYGYFRSVPAEGFDRVIPVLEGAENLQGVFDTGRGVILVTGHIGNWELGGLYFGHSGVKVNVVTLPEGNDQIDEIRKTYRNSHLIDTIVLDGSPFATLEMMAALRRGEMVAMLVDRWGKADGVTSSIFGAVHHLPRGPFALSRATGAAILPAFVVREGTTYRGILEPPFVVEGDDEAQYARRVSEALERVIRRFPDQWYNFEPIQ